ncbi:MAG: YdcF family protein [Clostridia bacterium]|nr:YdcF family protein [Clostridia bacterium]
MRRFDVILLPGLRLEADGRPRRELLDRVSAAADLWHRGLAPKIVACGGDAAGVGVSEAQVIRQKLLELGVSPEAIVTEDASLITAENFQNAVRLVGRGARAALCTSDYHMARARLLCRRAGFKPKGFKVKTPGGAGKRKLLLLEALGILDALCGWQDEGRKRPKRVERFKNWVAGKLGGRS